MAKKRGRPKGSKNKVSKNKVYDLVLGVGKRERRAKPQAKKRAQRGPKPQCVLLHTQLRPIIREAARTGLVEAIEHTGNFWNVSDGYKKYIEQQIALQSDALMTAVRTVISEELSPFRREIARARRRKRTRL